MEKINYTDASVTWRIVETKTKKGATKQWQAIIRFKTPTGTAEDGTTEYAIRKKSKLFPTSRLSAKMTPKGNATRFRNALNEWKAELEAEQEAMIEREVRKQLEEERKRQEEEPARASPWSRRPWPRRPPCPTTSTT